MVEIGYPKGKTCQKFDNNNNWKWTKIDEVRWFTYLLTWVPVAKKHAVRGEVESRCCYCLGWWCLWVRSCYRASWMIPYRGFGMHDVHNMGGWYGRYGTVLLPLTVSRLARCSFAAWHENARRIVLYGTSRVWYVMVLYQSHNKKHMTVMYNIPYS